MAYTGRSCWLCGRNGTAEPLDKHHIFGGAYRKKSEKLGLCVDLCHGSCHIFGSEAVHANAETMQRLHEYGQRKAMQENGWSIEEFRLEFGKNYIDEDEPEPVQEVVVSSFCILMDAAPLPF